LSIASGPAFNGSRFSVSSIPARIGRARDSLEVLGVDFSLLR
jgi:hypothetical protein